MAECPSAVIPRSRHGWGSVPSAPAGAGARELGETPLRPRERTSSGKSNSWKGLTCFRPEMPSPVQKGADPGRAPLALLELRA